jgi:hypothetical protein
VAGWRTVPGEWTAAAVRDVLADDDLAVVEGEHGLASVVDRASLDGLSGPLAGADLPPLVAVEVEEPGVPDPETLLALAEVLSLIPAVGVVLERDGAPVEVLSRIEVAQALPLDLLTRSVTRATGTPDLPTQRYVCRKCVPPSYRLPRTVEQGQPQCRRVWFHGAMEPDGEVT